MPVREFSGLFLMCLAGSLAPAQDLTPRAYVITPVGSNAVTLTYSMFSGAVSTDPTLPLTDFTARYHAQVLSGYRAFNLLGRSANVVASFPYVLGNFHARVASTEARAYRSGIADVRFRLSVNLLGGPAMRAKEFLEWHEKTTLGASLTFSLPTGQYDPARAVNIGTHRFAWKPELGLSRRFRGWSLDLYGGVWFFSENSRYLPGDRVRSQAPVATGEAHLVRHLTRRCWASFDSNFWSGGRTTIDRTPRDDYQKNSRLGGTLAFPVTRHQSVKISYSTGAYISIGGDYRNLAVAWQYSWLSR